MKGIVLCGGRSTRMGEDKGSKLYKGRYWATIIKNILSHEMEVVFSVNEFQFERYSKQYSSEELILDKYGDELNGPLKGLLSVHEKFPHETLFVLPCDLILMDQELVSKMISDYQKNKCDALIPVIKNFVQPISAIYSADMLSDILKKAVSGVFNNESMRRVLSVYNVREYNISTSEEGCFRNFNSLDDFKEIEG